MAFTDSEIKKFNELSDEMAKLIEDEVNTSNEASVIYSQVGRICSRALARHAALEAKRTFRADHVSKFKNARQSRADKVKNKKQGGPASSSPAQTSGRAGTQQTRSA